MDSNQFENKLIKLSKCDELILDLNRSKRIIPLPHVSKWNDKHPYFQIFRIKREVLENRNISECKYEFIDKIENKNQFKKIMDLISFLNDKATVELIELYNKYLIFVPN